MCADGLPRHVQVNGAGSSNYIDTDIFFFFFQCAFCHVLYTYPHIYSSFVWTCSLPLRPHSVALKLLNWYSFHIQGKKCASLSLQWFDFPRLNEFDCLLPITGCNELQIYARQLQSYRPSIVTTLDLIRLDIFYKECLPIDLMESGCQGTIVEGDDNLGDSAHG